MRRFLLITAMIVSLATTFAFVSSSAAAGTTVSVFASFTEPVVPAAVSGDCPVLGNGFCGSGVVVPFGHATEMIDFFAGCGGACDIRTIDLRQGSIVTEEFGGDLTCPGSCTSGGYGFPATLPLTDVIVGGAGIFTGATGTLTGSVSATVLQSHVSFSGTVTLAN